MIESCTVLGHPFFDTHISLARERYSKDTTRSVISLSLMFLAIWFMSEGRITLRDTRITDVIMSLVFGG